MGTIERQASAQPSLAERVSRPKTRAILGLMRLNFLSVRIVADLRAGNLVLRERWTSCQTSSGLPRSTANTGEPDAGTADRDESAGRIVQAAAQCDAQVKGLQNLLRLERQSQPEVGSHVGPLPD